MGANRLQIGVFFVSDARVQRELDSNEYTSVLSSADIMVHFFTFIELSQLKSVRPYRSVCPGPKGTKGGKKNSTIANQ